MNTVCPACGVAVVPGYIRCPRCHAGLPLGLGRTKRTTADPGGTSVARRGFPLSALLVALGVAVALIAAFGLRGTTRKVAVEPAAAPGPIPAITTHEQPPTEVVRAPVAAALASAPEPTVQDPAPAIAELKSALRAQRLWGSVDILGQRVDVRSGSCADPAMRPLIDAQKTLLHGAGLTKLRCVEQSGAVVFERDL